ncbi:hypothetical protein EMCRGX_G015623 [Ephydatia muelleri]
MLHLRLPCTSYPQIKSQSIISCANISLSDDWLLGDLAPHLCCHISCAVSDFIVPLNDEPSLLAIQGMLKRHGGPTFITSGRQTNRIPYGEAISELHSNRAILVVSSSKEMLPPLPSVDSAVLVSSSAEESSCVEEQRYLCP